MVVKLLKIGNRLFFIGISAKLLLPIVNGAISSLIIWQEICKLEFPNSTGYSARNLKYMRKFAEIFDDDEIVPTLLAQLTWSHHFICLLFDIESRKGDGWVLIFLEKRSGSRALASAVFKKVVF